MGSSDPALSSVLTCSVLLFPVLLLRLYYLDGGRMILWVFPTWQGLGMGICISQCCSGVSLPAGSAAAGGCLHLCLSPETVPGSDLLETLSTCSSDSGLENVVMPSPLLPEHLLASENCIGARTLGTAVFWVGSHDFHLLWAPKLWISWVRTILLCRVLRLRWCLCF